MRRATILSAAAGLLVAACALTACTGPVQGSGTVVTKSLPVPGAFSAVKGEGALTLVVRRGDPASISVRSDDNVVGLVQAEVDDGTLRLFTDGSWSTSDGLVVTVTAPAVGGVGASGSVQATADVLANDGGQAWVVADGASRVSVERVESQDLLVRAVGASQVQVDHADPATLEAKATGASSIVVHGACGHAKLHAEGASRIGDAELKAKTADVVVAGASSADLDVADTLQADAMGASKVTYGGEPVVKGSVGKTASVSQR